MGSKKSATILIGAPKRNVKQSKKKKKTMLLRTSDVRKIMYHDSGRSLPRKKSNDPKKDQTILLWRTPPTLQLAHIIFLNFSGQRGPEEPFRIEGPVNNSPFSTLLSPPLLAVLLF